MSTGIDEDGMITEFGSPLDERVEFIGSGENTNLQTGDVIRGPQIVTSAQNFEDVLLWRVLQRYGPGFYIDLGAGEPDAESVTRLFYEHGWRGVNVEPMASPFERLRNARPRDINLNVAIEDSAGSQTYFEIDGGGGLSTGTQELADAYRTNGHEVREVQVDTMTLAEVCSAFVSQEIHFLKIDVEGRERAVLNGADFDKYRPWIILIEVPGIKENAAAPEWEDLVTQAGYSFIYFDGLNRFYVATEKADLLAGAFRYPVGWFDNFVSRSESTLRARVDDAEQAVIALTADLEVERTRSAALIDVERQLAAEQAEKFAQARELDSCYQELWEDSRQIGYLARERQTLMWRLDEVARERDQLGADAAVLRDRVDDLMRSTSWRATAPLRGISRVIRRTAR